MNRLFLILLTTGFFLTGCETSRFHTGNPFNGSTNRSTKTVFVYSHAYQFGEASPDGRLTEVMEYDPYGNLTIHRMLGVDKQLRSQINYIYNHLNQLIETRFYNNQSRLETRVVLKYDESGRHIRNTEYDETGAILNAEVFRYGTNNKVSETIYYGSGGTLLWKTSYTYTENDRKVEIITRESGGIITRQEVLHFNSLFQITEKFDYMQSGTLRQIFAYQYDVNGNRTMEECYYPDGSLSWQVAFKYDRYGRIVQTERIREDGQVENRGVSFYNSDGIVARDNPAAGNGNFSKEIFAYDNHGNRTHWIKYDPVLNEPVELVRYVYEFY